MRSNNNKPESIFFVGICGGSCAGKSEFAAALRRALGTEYCHILAEDCYYRDQSNLDHPDDLDFELLFQHLIQLQQGRSIEVPIYDFITRKRLAETKKMYPSEVVLLEGTLILSQPNIVKLLSESIFLDISEEMRLQRRILRDTTAHALTPEDVLVQFNNYVKPVHERFIEPSKKLATYVIDQKMNFNEVIEDIVGKLGVDS